ncbi:MAG: hypothetical protein JWM57_3941 [Phycisphaerales bacterium]|nr:hypothetical protein [Phycisphaerales bacterium]
MSQNVRPSMMIRRLSMALGQKRSRSATLRLTPAATGSPAQQATAKANERAFAATVAGRGWVTTRVLEFRNEKRDSVAARSAANLFADDAKIAGYTNVVVDVTAMPRVVWRNSA